MPARVYRGPPSYRRKFGGEVFVRTVGYLSRTDARRTADRCRAGGRKARSIKATCPKLKHAWVVYTKAKPKATSRRRR